MRTTEDRFRRVELEDAIARVSESRSVVIAGPNGSGRTEFLGRMVDLLRTDGEDVVELPGHDPASTTRAAAADERSTIVVDELELAEPALLEALEAHATEGGALVVALDTSHWRSHRLMITEHSAGPAASPRVLLSTAHWVQLEPLEAQEIEHLLHDHTDDPADSDAIHAVCELAEGRPRWALDLLTLAHHGSLSTCPSPAISSVPFGALHLPAVLSLNGAIGPLPAEIAAMAVALSDFAPRDATGVIELIGAQATTRLLEHGVLVRVPGTELHYVPPFIAFALRHRADPADVSRTQGVTARQLLLQESLGFPITRAEAAQCARVLGAHPADSALDLTPVEMRTMQTVTSDLLSFNEAALAKTLLVRTGTTDHHEDPLHRVKALTVLAGPAAGCTELDALSFPTDSSESIAAQALRSQLVAETRRHPPDFTAAAHGMTDQERLFEAWNTVGPLVERHFPLRAMATRMPSVELSDSANALYVLDRVVSGRLPEGSWLATGAPLPLPGADAPQLMQPMLGATLLAQATASLLSGELAARTAELHEAARRLDPEEYHARWLRHLLAAGTALACGDTRRAQIEWDALHSRMPRFIPLRLRDALTRIGTAISESTVEDPDTPADLAPGADTAHRFIAYLTGRHDVLLCTRATGRRDGALPTIRLANAHLAASEEQNPAELLRIAVELQRIELWAPAGCALSEARSIFLSRRASGGVRKCDRTIAELVAQQRRQVPWYRPGDLPTSDRVRLTPREQSVADLAAAGLTNREIADRLGCSPRTIESHLAQARAKLGAESRHDLAGMLPRPRHRMHPARVPS